MHRLLTIALLLALTITVSCAFGGGFVFDEDEQVLRLTEGSAPTAQTVLNLEGPEGNGSAPIAYYVFGSDVTLGDRDSVPLGNFRKDEVLVATLDTDEQLLDVDLSPWAAYDRVYLRAVPPTPQIIFELKDGKTYTFSSN
jgi:hypothetical protein